MRAHIHTHAIPQTQSQREGGSRPKAVRFARVAANAIACFALVTGASLAHADDVAKPDDFLGSAMQDGRAEIQSCQLALQKSSDASVQAFAKRMIADHESLDSRIEALAKQKGYSLPDGISLTQKATKAELSVLSGHAFDKVFMKHNVSDHKDDIKRFSEQAQQGSDPEVRALAADAVPTLKKHLKLAEQTRAKVSR